jgi:chemotaxis response regulator CheB
MSATEQSSIDDAKVEGTAAVAVVVVSLSAGGLTPLRHLIRGLSSNFPAAIVIAQHVREFTVLPEILAFDTTMPVSLAHSGMMLRPARIYVCPGQKHVIVNPDATLSVSARGPVRFFRPNADWLFESAAASFRDQTFAVVLSGFKNDAARGATAVQAVGGTVIVQAPETCERPEMPIAAIETGSVHHILVPGEIAPKLEALLKRIDVCRCRSAWENPFSES